MRQKQFTMVAGSIFRKYTTSTWLAANLALAYLLLLTLVIFVPGASLLARLHWLDSGICAQMSTHTFYPGGQPLPLCARNTGIYLGFIITLVLLYALGYGHTQRLPARPILALLSLGVLALTLDGLNSFALDVGLPHLYQPHNLLRLATGLLTGLALGLLTIPMLNSMLWQDYNPDKHISSWYMLLPFVLAILFCFFALASQSGYILYPVALLSTAGLLTALGSLNLAALVLILKRAETFTRYRDLSLFFGIAVLFAAGELLLLAQLKLQLLQIIG